VTIAKEALVIKLAGQPKAIKTFAEETMKELTTHLIKKARADLGKKSMAAIDFEIGLYMDDRFTEFTEKFSDEQLAAKIFGRVIRVSIDSVNEVTNVRTSVPHSGRLGEIREEIRSNREFSNSPNVGGNR